MTERKTKGKTMSETITATINADIFGVMQYHSRNGGGGSSQYRIASKGQKCIVLFINDYIAKILIPSRKRPVKVDVNKVDLDA
jgi:hypothetical protein